jgi:hypothetical protein
MLDIYVVMSLAVLGEELRDRIMARGASWQE